MISTASKLRGAILLEALGALCILTAVLGGILLLLTVTSAAKRQALLRVRLEYLLNTELDQLDSQIGRYPDCSLHMEDAREIRISDRTFFISRSVRGASWDTGSQLLQLLQLSVEAVPENGVEVHQETAFALRACASMAAP